MVPWKDVVVAAEAVGKEVLGKAAVYAYLGNPGTRLGSGVEPEPPEEPVTLASVLSDLYDALDGGAAVGHIIADLEALIGPYTGEALPDDEPAEGIGR